MELQLQHLSKCYGAKQAVNDVSTVLTPGVYGLLGANGAGQDNFNAYDLRCSKAYFRQYLFERKEH